MKHCIDKLIIITGAAGFIGSGVVRYLNDQGIFHIICVDQLEKDGRWKNLNGKKFVDFIPKNELFEWLEGRDSQISAFVHLGACSDTTETNGNYLIENNYRYTQKLAEYALTNKQRFIYASSAATYGDGSLGFVDDHYEIDSLRPLNLYGYSKQLFDQWAFRQGVLDRIVGLKYFNVFGPNEWHKGRMASAILFMKDQILKEGEVRLFASNDPAHYKDGEQKRDFLYVKDAAAMTCAFLNNDIGGIFNIGKGQASTWNELAEAVFTALGKPKNIKYIQMPKDLEGKYQNYTCADMQKYLSYDLPPPTYDLKSAVVDYVQEHLVEMTVW